MNGLYLPHRRNKGRYRPTTGRVTKIFVDTNKAAAILGMERRTFERKYVYTEIIRLLEFPGEGCAKHIFLRDDVEALKHASHGGEAPD